MRCCLAVAVVAVAACSPQAAPVSETPPAAIEPTLQAGEIPAPAGEIMVTSPGPEARVTSPLVVEGVVQSDWVFEGQFPTWIEVDGKKIVEGPAMHILPEDGSYPDPTKFRAELAFTVDKDTPATLVLQEDMPQPVTPDSDVAGPARTLRIPVTLTPTAQ